MIFGFIFTEKEGIYACWALGITVDYETRKYDSGSLQEIEY